MQLCFQRRDTSSQHFKFVLLSRKCLLHLLSSRHDVLTVDAQALLRCHCEFLALSPMSLRSCTYLGVRWRQLCRENVLECSHSVSDGGSHCDQCRLFHKSSTENNSANFLNAIGLEPCNNERDCGCTRRTNNDEERMHTHTQGRLTDSATGTSTTRSGN